MKRVVLLASVAFVSVAGSASARSFTPQLDVSATDSDGGSHPQLTIKVSKTADSVGYDEQDFKDVTIGFPTGLNFNPRAIPYCGLVEDINGGHCSNPGAEIGTASIDAQVWVPLYGPIPLKPIPGTIYNEAPQAGELARTVVIFESTNWLGNTIPGFAISDAASFDSTTMTTSIEISSLPNTVPDSNPPVPFNISGLTLNFDGSKGSDSGQPLITNPTSCSAHSFTAGFTSYGDDNVSSSDDQTLADQVDYPVQNCDRLPFNPQLSVAVEPTTVGAVPTVRQSVTQQPGEAAIGSTVFSMPAGFKFNPGRTILTCSSAQIDSASCPEASKLSDITIETPLFSQPMVGTSYLGPAEGENLRVVTFITAPISTSFEGRLTQRADGGTDTVTTGMSDMPITKMEYVMGAGGSGLFANPYSCGPQAISASLTSLSGKTVVTGKSFDITGCISASSEQSRTFQVKVSPNLPKRRALLKVRLSQSRSEEVKQLKMVFAKGLSWNLAHHPRSLAAGFIAITGDDDISRTVAIYPRRSKSPGLKLVAKKESGSKLAVKIAKSKSGKATVTVTGFRSDKIKDLSLDLTGRRRLLLRTPSRCKRSTVKAVLSDGSGQVHSLSSAIAPGCSKSRRQGSGGAN